MALLAQRYELGALLGAGGVGAVFRAHDRVLSRDVAVKVVRQRFDPQGSQLNRLTREANAMARISHPHVVEVFDVCRYAELTGVDPEVDVPASGVAIVIEYVRGQDLRAWLQQSHAPRDTLRIFFAAAEGLIAAHNRGIVHRDFKPANVLLGEPAVVKVTDFGLAAAWTDGGGPIDSPTFDGSSDSGQWMLESRLTGTGLAMGTPLYMAPEQHRGEAVDPRTDQYAWALALAEALRGQRPVDGVGTAELLQSKLELRLPNDTPLPPRGRAALQRALSPRPEDRFASMRQLVVALGERPSPRRWMITAGVVGVAGIGLLVPSPRSSSPPSGGSISEADTQLGAAPGANAATRRADRNPPSTTAADAVAAIEALQAEANNLTSGEYRRRIQANVDLARASEDQELLARALLGKASMHAVDEDFAAALSIAERAYDIAVAAESDRIAARAASVIYYNLERGTAAHTRWRRATETHIERCGGDARAEGNVLRSDLRAARYEMRWDDALGYAQRILEQTIEVYGADAHRTGLQHFAVAEYQRRLEQTDEALRSTERGMQLVSASEPATGAIVVQARVDLALIHAIAGDSVQARAELATAERLYGERTPDEGHDLLGIYVFVGGATALQHLGDHEAALRYFARAPHDAEDDPYRRFMAHALITKSLLALGRKRDAVVELDKSLQYVDPDRPEWAIRTEARELIAKLRAELE